MSSSTMVIVVIVFVTDVIVAVAVVIVATKVVDAIVIAVAVSVIIRAIVIVAYGSTPFTTGFQQLLSVIRESFAAIESYYLEIA